MTGDKEQTPLETSQIALISSPSRSAKKNARRRRRVSPRKASSESEDDDVTEPPQEAPPKPQRKLIAKPRRAVPKPPDVGVQIFSEVGRFLTGTLLQALYLAFAFLKTPLYVIRCDPVPSVNQT